MWPHYICRRHLLSNGVVTRLKATEETAYLAFSGTIRGSNTKRLGSLGSIRALTQWVLRGPEGLDASEVREHATSGSVERFIDLEVMTVAMHKRYLSWE